MEADEINVKGDKLALRIFKPSHGPAVRTKRTHMYVINCELVIYW